MFSYEKGVEGGELVRLVALRRPRLPVPEAVGRGRLRRARRHARHLRRDPARLLEPDRAARRHGRQPRRGVDLLPEHAAPLLRPDVLERQDKELALLCVQAYNDWMIDEWCAGDGQGPADPAHDGPAVGRRARRRRGAPLRRQGQLRGRRSPRTRTRSACRRSTTRTATGTRSSRPARRPSTVVCMHIGSSSKMPATSPDAPFIVSSTLTFSNAMGSMLDYIFSGTLERFPDAEDRLLRGPGRLDALRDRAGRQALGRARRQQLRHVAAAAAVAATSTDRIYGCIFDDEIGLANRDVIGMDQICFETDYPHADSHVPALARRSPATSAPRPASTTRRPTSSSAATPSRAFGLERFGITS